MADKGYRETTDEELRRLVNDERFVHFIGMIRPRRPGVTLFAIKLEHLYFPPGTEKNDEFIFHIIEWQNMIWMVVSIPKQYMDLAKKIATEARLRIADGVPIMITSERIQSFPMDSDKVFTLENVPEHVIYENRSDVIEKLLAEENTEIVKILEDFLSRRN